MRTRLYTHKYIDTYIYTCMSYVYVSTYMYLYMYVWRCVCVLSWNARHIRLQGMQSYAYPLKERSNYKNWIRLKIKKIKRIEVIHLPWERDPSVIPYFSNSVYSMHDKPYSHIPSRFFVSIKTFIPSVAPAVLLQDAKPSFCNPYNSDKW